MWPKCVTDPKCTFEEYVVHMSASLSVTIKKESDFPISIKKSGWSLENAGLYFSRASPRTCMQIICTCILHWWVVYKSVI